MQPVIILDLVDKTVSTKTDLKVFINIKIISWLVQIFFINIKESTSC